MSADPKSAEQNEKKEDCESSPSTKQQGHSKFSKFWKKAMDKLRSTGQIKGNTADARQPSAVDSLVKLIRADLGRMSREADALTKYNSQLARDLGTLEGVFEDIKVLGGDEKQKVDRLNTLRKELMKVKLAIPSKYDVREDKDEHEKKLKQLRRSICGEESKKIPQLHNSDLFKTSMELKDFEARYEELEEHARLCLLCFSIFPQGATVKKRLMLQWWVVEGFASTEEDADSYFKELMEKGFIEAVNNNRSLSVGSCRLHPFHRAALVTLAERAKLFNFGNGGDPTQNFSGSFQACLMGAGLISYEDFEKRNKEAQKGKDDYDPVKVIKGLTQELEKLHLLMNVDEHILEFINEWFGKMKNLNFLYLGRWKAEATHHIEVDDPKFLEELKKMKHVKLLSLQGVSNIIALPQSIQQLTNLDVLDLRACSNLESIPERIDFLKKLTHLDMSECYLLAHMPKALSDLNNLKVLKGFFVNQSHSKNSCTLADLQKLGKLQKLCIYTDWEDFPLQEHVAHLQILTTLTKLTITWGVGSNINSSNPEVKTVTKKPTFSPPVSAKLPPKLEKLDLKCFPKADTPSWLKLENLEGIELKKLYIRGGKFRDIGQYQGIDDASESQRKWRVEVLRLKYLGEMEMEWRQLPGLFPKLKYLEKVSCPNLTFFPCDAKGVWINPE